MATACYAVAQKSRAFESPTFLLTCKLVWFIIHKTVFANSPLSLSRRPTKSTPASAGHLDTTYPSC